MQKAKMKTITAMIQKEWWSMRKVTSEALQGAVLGFIVAFCPNHITEHELTAANNGEALMTQHN